MSKRKPSYMNGRQEGRSEAARTLRELDGNKETIREVEASIAREKLWTSQQSRDKRKGSATQRRVADVATAKGAEQADCRSRAEGARTCRATSATAAGRSSVQAETESAGGCAEARELAEAQWPARERKKRLAD